MPDLMGNNGGRAGNYVGEAPSRGGFGRRGVAQGAPPADLHSLSGMAQPFVEEHRAQPSTLNDIDFTIGGNDIQHVEIELDPGEAVVAENGSMIWKDAAIDFSLVLGDGKDDNAGFASKLMNAGSNLIAGESFYMSEFRHHGAGGKAKVAFGGKLPGNILPIRLEAMGGTLICRRESFLAAAKGVAIKASFQRSLASGLLGGEGLVMQTLHGAGWAFLHVGGTLIERELGPSEVIHVHTGCLTAHEPSVEMTIRYVGGVMKAVAAEGSFFLSELRGPGKVWIQTMQHRPVDEARPADGGRMASSVREAVADYGFSTGLDALQKLF